MKLYIVLVALAMYALVMVFIHRKAAVALGAGALVLAAGILFPSPGTVSLCRAFGTLVNWNILAIYVGSLVIADLFVYSRVPAALADCVVDMSPTLGFAIVTILVITGLVSAFVENVATVLVMAPIALELCRRVKTDPRAFLMGLAVMANLQGTATLVGDPPSMIFASYAGYGFNDFFVYDGRLSIFFVVQAGATMGALYFYAYFRKLQKVHLDLPVEKVVSWVPTVLLTAMIAGLALISFLTRGGLHASSGVLSMALAVVGLAWFMLVRKEPLTRAKELVRRLDWDTILFLVGVFIVIGAIADIGLLKDLADFLAGVVAGNVLVGFVLIVTLSVVISGFVDNVPYIVAMLPVADALTRSLGVRRELLMFGLLIGSCLGGNLTPFGASANVVVAGLAKKEGHPVGFLEWLKVGGPFTVVTTLAAALTLYAIWR